ncbi:hypothetical protein BDV36DRAFT_174693 [Aspergillus pseudocaelatus]|uniref:Nucleolar protein Dnt1-like N-terminal domain-containing protein n=1 Tax=Aspergillus pseudocaelatus TaxID=1825620 RepID=A0ABQ6X265_9EURO|nr:hypothetical protein BDV36DRAFT_174693 [Aspergillus pseudocaelatus]
MVFIRLIIKVYPREQLSRPFPTPNRKSFNTTTESETKPASFLLALPNPEEITLGQLAGLIRSKWTKLRPNAEPLDIKKLLDDSRDTVDLDVDMTVADVWVNQARAKRDEDDQVGTVRVVQRPAAYAPVRFPSVDQDWGVGREEKFTGKFETIQEAGESETDSGSGSEEEEEESESEKKTLIESRAMEVDGQDDEESETDESEEEEGSEEEESESGSEEDENEKVNGRANEEEESGEEGESEEESAPDNDVRMEDSLPETRVLKRKMSPEELEPKKQPRLAQSSQATEADAENVNGAPVTSPLGTRKRNADRAPSFSGVGRRLSFTERPALSHGLGLGITKSPPRKKPFLMADLSKDSTQSESVPNDARLSPTSVPPSSAPPAIRRSSGNQHPSTPARLQTPADKVRLLQSALRKDSPAERSPERRSVSFAEGEDHAIPTSVPVTRATARVTNEKQKNGTNSGSEPAPPEPEEPSDEEEGQSEDKEMEFSKELNMEINEYERELQTNDLDEKSEYTRKVKLAAKKWQIMKNNMNKGRRREQERYKNAVNELKDLHPQIVELKEFNKPPSQRPKSQIPNGTPATRKLSRDPTSSQNRRSQDPWDVEILTPNANSKKLIPKNHPSSQTSRKSSEREEAQPQDQKKRQWSVEIPTTKTSSSLEKQPEPRKLSQERPPSPPTESESESESEKSGSEEENTSEHKKPSSQEKPPPPPAESESEEESGSEEEEDNTAPSQPNSPAKPSPQVKVSVPEPVPEPGSDSEQQSGSEEEDEDEEDEEDEKDESTDEESENEDDNNKREEKKGEIVQEPERQEDDIVPETEEEREQETTTQAQPNPPPTETPSNKPDPAAEETDSDTDEEEESDDESEKENHHPLPKSTPTTKANVPRRTSLNPPSSQPNPPSSQQQPTSSQSTPTGSRPTRNTLKTLLFQQRAEQAQARLKKEEEAAKRNNQPRKDIFSGPDSESEDEDESDSDSESDSESESESDSGADAGDILSSGTIGKLRTALPRK